ncbi:MAG: 1-acyl-sn-glycerol-3-phosphate acyltransferase, partial [Acidimicrobiia bacterium]|nr:1-acyl-sn-glycerol-3-phosphate acyltransferase [Acidimicrobiia bacterium]
MEPLYDVARVALLGPMRLGVHWTIDGAHRVPVYGPAIVASNHVSYLDPLALAYLANERHRRVRFLAKAELFDKTGLGWALRQIQQIPVQRDTADAAASLAPAVEALRSGECVTVFPEGTISLDLEPMAGKTGTARLAALSGVPVIPVGLWGLHRILFKGRRP